MGTLQADKGPRKLDQSAQIVYRELGAMQAMSAKDKVSAADAVKLQSQANKTYGTTAEPSQSGPNWRMGKFKTEEESYAEE